MYIPQRTSFEQPVALFIAAAGFVLTLNAPRFDGLWITGWAVAAAALSFSVYRFLARRRAEGAHLLIDSPALPGATFAGRIVTGLPTAPSEIVIILTCERTRIGEADVYDKVGSVVDMFDNKRNYRRGRSTVSKKIFEKSQLVKRRAMVSSADGFVAPFSFQVPMDAQAGMIGRDLYGWQLEAEADIPGVDFKASFEVVFG